MNVNTPEYEFALQRLERLMARMLEIDDDIETMPTDLVERAAWRVRRPGLRQTLSELEDEWSFAKACARVLGPPRGADAKPRNRTYQDVDPEDVRYQVRGKRTSPTVRAMKHLSR